jgi:phage tail sheath protein FI
MVMYDSKAPGVYIEEISGGARPIQAVGTSTAGFVGVAPHPNAPTGEAIAVNNWLEFMRRFRVDVEGELEAAKNDLEQATLAVPRAKRKLEEAAAAETGLRTELEQASATKDSIAALKTAEDAAETARQAFKTAQDTTAKARKALDSADDNDKDKLQKALDAAIQAEDKAQAAQDTATRNVEAALAALPAAARAAARRKESAQRALETANQALAEAESARAAAEGSVTAVQGTGGPSTHLVQAVYGFFLNGGTRCYVANVRDDALQDGLDWLSLRDEVAIVAAPGYTDQGDYEAVLTHCENLKDRVAILDPPGKVDDTGDLTDTALARPRSSGYGSFYYPWIVVRAPLTGDEVAAPPSGHLAGVWARTDAERGVHKAPANTPIRGALKLVDEVAADEQGMLNQRGVNCIRFFSSDGILVWGARTLSSDPEWRYLNVRRLLNMIEESIQESTRWAVFEPNDASLWAALRRDASAFLTRIWRTGALRGSTPEQAFFVKCDEETNPTENIDAGIVTTVIGVAPVKPAEYVVFQIRQYQPGSEVETQGG